MSEGESLLQCIGELIDSGRLQLPVFGDTALRLQSIAAGEDFDMDEVEDLIRSDQALSAEVLRAANSAFFAGLVPIKTIRSAVVRISLKEVSRLVFLVSEQSKYKAKDAELRKKLQILWKHTSTTALAAAWLSRRLNFHDLEETALLGGLLHDVGQLVILRALDAMKTDGNFPFDFSTDLVQQVLQSAHTDLGYDLLKRWNIPDVYCRIARDHHKAEFNPTDTPLMLVRLANCSTSKQGISLSPDPSLVLNALPEAQSLGASEIMLAELELMIEDHIAEGFPQHQQNNTFSLLN